MSSQLNNNYEFHGWTVENSGVATYMDNGVLRRSYKSFHHTLTLAFIQFIFVGLASLSIFLVGTIGLSKDTPLASLSQSFKPLVSTLSNQEWPALVTTHIFGSVLLQSLIMPAQMMSLSLFAATRAVEIPVAAAARQKIFGANSSGPSICTTGLMFAAAWLLFFSYTQISECLCVWSGFGVALSGLPLYIVYALVLTLPAANTVLQESVLVRLQVNPLLMLAIQNLAAAVLFAPILLAAHFLGFENVHQALNIVRRPEVCMTIVWLCVQTTILSMVTIGMILTMDSFWAVAAHSLRVVFWWSRQLQIFYLTSSTLLSVSRPHASLWSFVMVCGIILGSTAFITDRRQEKDDVTEEKALLSESDRLGKYHV